MVSDMKVHKKHWYVIKFHHKEILHQLTFIAKYYLRNVYGDQKADVSTVRWWIICFSSGSRDVCEKVGANFYDENV